MTDWPYADMTELAIEAECFETPAWAVNAILDAEVLTHDVIDPCCGRGVMSDLAAERGYRVIGTDLHDWGYKRGYSGPFQPVDFLDEPFFVTEPPVDWTCFINPPFSRAADFVMRALDRGARKVVCFQRFAWWESKSRRNFWDAYPPNRVYVLAERAHCWRVDIPPEKRTSSTPTAHAWFVWEAGNPPGTTLHRLYKPVKGGERGAD